MERGYGLEFSIRPLMNKFSMKTKELLSGVHYRRCRFGVAVHGVNPKQTC